MSAPVPTATVQDILELIKSLSTTDLLKVASAATTLAAKNIKNAPVLPTKKAQKHKKASRKMPPSDAEDALEASDASDATDATDAKKPTRGLQLVKPRAWVTYVLEDARANGWSAFTITQTKKDKMTGVKTESPHEVPASASEPNDGKYTFEGGKDFIHKYAMSLSKIYWSVKSASGSRKDLYDAFEAQYVPPHQD